MAYEIQREGQYELFYTTNDNRILRLDDDWFALVEGQRGELLAGSDSDHEKKETIHQGEYKLIDFNNDAKFKDMPHLFMEKNGQFTEAILPRGLPSQKGDREKIIRLDESMAISDLESYLESPEEGPGEERMDRPGGGSMSNVTYHLQGIDFPATKNEVLEFARDKAPPGEVIKQLEKLPDTRLETMADLTDRLGKVIAKERPPIDNYDDKSAREIIAALDELDRAGLEKVKEFEKDFYGRKTILRKVDTLLEGEQPIENYFDLTAKEVRQKLDEMDEAELTQFKEYEKEHKNRKTVLEEIDRRVN